MKGLNILLDKTYHYLKKLDYDNLVLVTGVEGSGKSNFNLHGLDYWYSKVLGREVTEKDIKHINLDPKGFVTDLKDLNRYEMTVYDEAGDLSNIRQMDKFNYRVSLSYQVIRGLNLVTFLTIPSLFRLNPYFVKDRAKFLIHIYKRDEKRAYYQLYTKQKIGLILDINQYRLKKRVNVVNPVFHDTFKKYNGVLLKPYLAKKEKRLSTVREELYNSVIEQEKADKELEALYRSKQIVGTKVTSKIWDISEGTVRNRLKKLKLKPTIQQ